MSSLKDKLGHIPRSPGCYIFKDSNGKPIYIGKAKILRNRVRSYFQTSRAGDYKFHRLVSRIRDIETIQTDSEVEALILESNLVKEHSPRYNIQLKDDKSYPFIKVTDELFPQVFVTRSVRKGDGRYFGPYTSVKTLRATLRLIKQIFTIRSCRHIFTTDSIEQKKVKVCLDYHIQKCDGPCEGLVGAETYGRMIQNVRNFLNGNTREVLRYLKSEMEARIQKLKFEEAARFRDKIRMVERYSASQKVVSADETDRDIFAVSREGNDACGVVFKVRTGRIVGRQHYYFKMTENRELSEILYSLIKTHYDQVDYIPKEILLPVDLEDISVLADWLSSERGTRVDVLVPRIGDKHKLILMCERNAKLLLSELKLQKLKAKDSFYPKSLKSLHRDLRLSRIPRRIECFDISNIQGSDTVASMVVFLEGKPKKSEYRKFRIKTVTGPDDFSSMKEVIGRRYKKLMVEEKEFPDLIMVDGGKGQLSSAVEVLSELGIEINYGTSEGQDVIGLAKRLEEILLPGQRDAIMIPRTSSALKLLQRVRDEAHRFAITFHRQVRRRRTLSSELDEIRGIGSVRKKKLLLYFGSVKKLSTASVKELTEVDGISTETARLVFGHFHPGDSNPPT